MTRRWLLGVLLALPVAAVAGPQPQNISKWGQYARSCAPYSLYGFSATTTDAEALIDNDSAKVLVEWGSQLKVSCAGSDGNRALVCFHQDDDVGYSAAYDLAFNPDFGSAGDCGDGCGYYDDSSGGSGVAGHMPCVVVESGQAQYTVLSAASFYEGGVIRAPTGTIGRCTTVGTIATKPDGVLNGPCYAATDCADSGGVCTSDRRGNNGAFVAIRVSNTSVACQVEICH